MLGVVRDRRCRLAIGAPTEVAVGPVLRRGLALRVSFPRAGVHSRSMLVRRERPTDVEGIRGVIAAAFIRDTTPGETPPEVALVDQLRASDAWLPALSLVAVGSGGEVIGHVLCTRGWVASTPALALAPLSVRPDLQRRGVGLALMHAVLGASDALGEPLVALVGDPLYYSRFGFRPGEEYGIRPSVPEWRAHFQVRVLAAYPPSLRGAFAYPGPFDGI